MPKRELQSQVPRVTMTTEFLRFFVLHRKCLATNLVQMGTLETARFIFDSENHVAVCQSLAPLKKSSAREYLFANFLSPFLCHILFFMPYQRAPLPISVADSSFQIAKVSSNPIASASFEPALPFFSSPRRKIARPVSACHHDLSSRSRNQEIRSILISAKVKM